MLPALVGILLSVQMLGCGSSAKQASASTKKGGEDTEQKGIAAKKGLPKIPGLDKDIFDEDVIKNVAPVKRDGYVQDKKYPSGALKGICQFRGVSSKHRTNPKRKTLEGNDVQIVKPRDGELTYYNKIGIREWRFVSSGKRGENMTPNYVVIRLLNVKVGRLPQAPRAVFKIHQGRLTECAGQHSFRSSMMACCGLGEFVTVGTYDAFPCQIRVTSLATSKTVFESKSINYVQTKIDKKQSYGKSGIHYKSEPDMIKIPYLNEAGPYRMACTRHPWQVGYVVMVDNPYVAMCRSQYHKPYPYFEMRDVPEGVHVLEVWHPEFQAVRKRVEVKIKRDQTTEIKIELDLAGSRNEMASSKKKK